MHSLIDTMTLTFDLSTPKPLSLLGYPKIIPYTKFEHFGTEWAVHIFKLWRQCIYAH